ncbi:MAG: hypothetical protein ACRDYV_17895 [Acidimicrobiia bacterium]
MDFKFLGLVALGLIVVTGGAALPLLPVSALIGLAALAFDAGTRLYDGWERSQGRR